MSRTTRIAIVLAVLVSAIALFDAVVGGVTGRGGLGDYDDGLKALLVYLPHAACYAALVVVLLTVGRSATRGSRWLTGLRRVLVAAYASMTVGMLLGAAGIQAEEGAVGLVVNLAFLVMLVAPAALGVTLLVRGDRSPSAWLLGAAGPVLALVILASVVAPGWEHPAYAETMANLGLALLGWRPTRRATRAARATAARPA